MSWIRTDAPGSLDEEVLKRSVDEARLLLTFDKDFGELTFRAGQKASAGIILFRISLDDLDHATNLVVKTVESRLDWTGHFAVVSDKQIRIRLLN